jgi:hypothetical protein
MEMIFDNVLEMFVRKFHAADDALSVVRLRDGIAFGTDTYAICYRSARPEDSDHDSAGIAPNAKSVIDQYNINFSKCTTPMPKINITPCKQCLGRGGYDTKKECHICHGSGEHECDECGAYHECGRCKGYGVYSAVIDCKFCGTAGWHIDGKTISESVIDVLGVPLNVANVFAIMHVTDVSIMRIYREHYDAGIIAFSGGEYRGLALGREHFDVYGEK